MKNVRSAVVRLGLLAFALVVPMSCAALVGVEPLVFEGGRDATADSPSEGAARDAADATTEGPLEYFLADLGTPVTSLEADDGGLYFAEEAGTIFTADLQGKNVAFFVQGVEPKALVSYHGDLYWLDRAADGGAFISAKKSDGISRYETSFSYESSPPSSSSETSTAGRLGRPRSASFGWGACSAAHSAASPRRSGGSASQVSVISRRRSVASWGRPIRPSPRSTRAREACGSERSIRPSWSFPSWDRSRPHQQAA